MQFHQKLIVMNSNVLLTACTLLVILFTSCTQEALVTTSTDIRLDSTSALGKHIVDKDGRTLYYFADDVAGQSTCTGGCTSVWSKFYADTTTSTYGDGLLASDFQTIFPSSGSRQTTYKGWPLYYYTPGGIPEATGETRGEGIGNIWFVAKNNYSLMIANYQLTDAAGITYLSNYTPGTGNTNYFCDAKGNTLYTFVRDSALINKSNGNVNFPVFEMDNITVPSTADKAQFVVITYNGKKQLTYKGWPLYYYTPDNFVRGSNKGFHFPATQPAGAIWPVAVKDIALAPR